MEIIDGKGRLFGKINIIDLAVIITLVFVVPAVYFGYRIALSRKDVVEIENGIDVKEKWLNITLVLQKVEPEVVSMMKLGDMDKDESDRVTAILTKLPDAEAGDVGASPGAEHSGKFSKKRILATFKMLCKERNGIFTYRNSSVKVGVKLAFSTSSYLVYGIIVGIEPV